MTQIARAMVLKACSAFHTVFQYHQTILFSLNLNNVYAQIWLAMLVMSEFSGAFLGQTALIYCPPIPAKPLYRQWQKFTLHRMHRVSRVFNDSTTSILSFEKGITASGHQDRLWQVSHFPCARASGNQAAFSPTQREDWMAGVSQRLIPDQTAAQLSVFGVGSKSLEWEGFGKTFPTVMCENRTPEHNSCTRRSSVTFRPFDFLPQNHMIQSDFTNLFGLKWDQHFYAQ